MFIYAKVMFKAKKIIKQKRGLPQSYRNSCRNVFQVIFMLSKEWMECNMLELREKTNTNKSFRLKPYLDKKIRPPLKGRKQKSIFMTLLAEPEEKKNYDLNLNRTPHFAIYLALLTKKENTDFDNFKIGLERTVENIKLIQ